jgi:GT2 family glycosyltransferase
MASGTYILFLNPDTIVPEDCFVKCISYFKQHPSTGAMGVRMIDGSGTYLKESKRGFPGPATALFKLTGLAALFPRSALFARYYLGNKEEHAVAEADVLSGAFLFTGKEVISETGGFDEAFFMYGEDIDLSYRIQQAGFRNIYYPEVTIIHFKGESTRKQSLKYITIFYRAMSIFVRKHYGGAQRLVFTMLLQAAIISGALLTGIFTAATAFFSFAAALFKKKADPAKSRLVIVAGVDDAGEMKKVIEKAGLMPKVKEWIILPQNNSFEKLQKSIRFPQAAVVFCESGTVTFTTIMSAMAILGRDRTILLHGQKSRSIVGSPGKNSNGIAMPLV